MAGISIEAIKELRERTGSGMMDCKKALTESNGDVEKAIDWLREKGIAKAQNKSSRIAAEGVVDCYIHGNGRIGVLIEVNIETDFAAQNEGFRSFVHEMAMQVAAMKPEWVSRDQVPAEVLDREREVVRNQALNEGKPEKVVDKIVEGRLSKFYAEHCLLDQPYMKDDSKSVQDLLTELTVRIGEKVSIRRFVRYEVGEGIEKRADDFAEEVQKQLKHE
ncbi:MAG: translation elongation factor Ts [Oscillospiraceae bacterium]|nr:translation elongation factor Ts [Oscillospiraceae bacterium]MDD4368102.1 translation elongation factor Ts [Oscillospiraceae bacterium]